MSGQMAVCTTIAGKRTEEVPYLRIAGVLFLRELGIPVAILTGEDTPMVAARAKKLKIEHVCQGVTDKVAMANQLCDQLGTSLDRAAYIGDDLNDLRLLEVVGLSGWPSAPRPM